jgi:hypothetical protein
MKTIKLSCNHIFDLWRPDWKKWINNPHEITILDKRMGAFFTCPECGKKSYVSGPACTKVEGV